MASGVAQQPNNAVVQINGHHFGTIVNPNADRTFMGHLNAYGKEASGNFRELQLLERVSRAASMVLKDLGNTLYTFFDDLAGKLGIAWAWLTLPRLPKATTDAVEAWTHWGEVGGPEGHPFRSALSRIHDLADCVAAWFYAASMVFNNMVFKNIADVPDTIANVTDLARAGEDVLTARRYIAQIDANDTALKERFEGTQTEAFLRLIKSTASVAGGILGLLVLALGGPILPAAALLAISLTSTIFAMAAHFYKETRRYEVVQFFENRSPMVEVGQPAHRVY